jgi:hypothetical protein
MDSGDLPLLFRKVIITARDCRTNLLLHEIAAPISLPRHPGQPNGFICSPRHIVGFGDFFIQFQLALSESK